MLPVVLDSNSGPIRDDSWKIVDCSDLQLEVGWVGVEFRIPNNQIQFYNSVPMRVRNDGKFPVSRFVRF